MVIDRDWMRQRLIGLEREHLKGRWPYVAIFVASVLLTLAFWGLLPSSSRLNDSSDYQAFYEPVARNIAAGLGIVRADGAPAIRYPPGYPLLLAALFKGSVLLGLSEASLLSAFALVGMGLTSVLVFTLARSVWEPLPATFAALVWMTNPLVLWLTKQPSSEIPFSVFFYGSFCLLWYALLARRRSGFIYFLSGLLTGIAMLIRPAGLGTGLVMVVILWQMTRRMTPRLRLSLATMLLVGNLMAIAPWEAWVYSQTGKVVLLSTGGVPGIRDGLTYAVSMKGFRQGSSVPPDVKIVMEDVLARYKQLNSFADLSSVVIDELKAHPLAMVKLLAIKMARSWYATDSQRLERPIMLVQLFYLLLLLGGSWAAWKRGGAPRQLVWSSWLLVLYFWAMTVISLSIARYMVPITGLLFVSLPALLPTSPACVRAPDALGSPLSS